jgi:hypothetical protein
VSIAAAAGTPACGAGSQWRTWRSGGTPAEGARAVRGWGSNAWQGRHRRWPAAARIKVLRRRQGKPETEQGSSGARRKKGKELN